MTAFTSDRFKTKEDRSIYYFLTAFVFILLTIITFICVKASVSETKVIKDISLNILGVLCVSLMFLSALICIAVKSLLDRLDAKSRFCNDLQSNYEKVLELYKNEVPTYKEKIEDAPEVIVEDKPKEKIVHEVSIKLRNDDVIVFSSIESDRQTAVDHYFNLFKWYVARKKSKIYVFNYRQNDMLASRIINRKDILTIDLKSCKEKI